MEFPKLNSKTIFLNNKYNIILSLLKLLWYNGNIKVRGSIYFGAIFFSEIIKLLMFICHFTPLLSKGWSDRIHPAPFRTW